MGKQQGRKPPKRAPRKPALDADLVELATMLAERQLDQNAEGWFSVPWRDGWNAAGLAHDAFWQAWGGFEHVDRAITYIAGDLTALIRERTQDADTYWRVGDWLARASSYPSDSHERTMELRSSAPMLRAALRCVQIRIAQADGGGEVYNAILRPAFEGLMPELYETVVENARCRDALGLAEAMHPGPYAARKRAFEIAWRRGLYQAAYAL